MFTSIIKELLGTKINEYNEIDPKHLLMLNRKAAIASYSFSERIKKHFW